MAKSPRITSVYVIVLSRNNIKDTIECLGSLVDNSYPLKKIILIDNGSDDGSTVVLKKYAADHPLIHFISNERNLGFAAGINIGIKIGLVENADYFFVLNNDTILDRDCIKLLINEMQKSGEVGITGPTIFYYNNRSRVWHGGGHYDLLRMGIVIPGKNKIATDTHRSSIPVTFVTGCAMMINSSLIKHIGLFDERYFLYHEDVDFCLKTSRHNFKIHYVPTAKVWHKIDIAHQRTTPFVLYHMGRSRILFLRKNFTFPYVFYGILLHIAFYTPYRILQIICGGQKLNSVTAWIRGSISGLNISSAEEK